MNLTIQKHSDKYKQTTQGFGILKLKDLHNFIICCTVHKFIHFPNMLPDAISEMFCTNAQVRNYDTRSKGDIQPLKIKTKLYGEEAISY